MEMRGFMSIVQKGKATVDPEPVGKPVNPLDLMTILTTYEGAVQEANDTPDDDEAIKRLEVARAELMKVLVVAREWEKAQREPHEFGIPEYTDWRGTEALRNDRSR